MKKLLLTVICSVGIVFSAGAGILDNIGFGYETVFPPVGNEELYSAGDGAFLKVKLRPFSGMMARAGVAARSGFIVYSDPLGDINSLRSVYWGASFEYDLTTSPQFNISLAVGYGGDFYFVPTQKNYYYQAASLSIPFEFTLIPLFNPTEPLEERAKVANKGGVLGIYVEPEYTLLVSTDLLHTLKTKIGFFFNY